MGGMEGAPCTCCTAQGSRSPFTTQLRAAELWVLSTAGTLEALGAPRAQPSTRHGGNGRPHPAEVVLRNRQVASLHPAALQQQRPVTGRGSCSTGQPPAASRRDTRSATAPLLQPPPGTGSQGPCSQVPVGSVPPPLALLCGVPLPPARQAPLCALPSPGLPGSAPSSLPGGGIPGQSRQGHADTDALVQLQGSQPGPLGPWQIPGPFPGYSHPVFLPHAGAAALPARAQCHGTAGTAPGQAEPRRGCRSRAAPAQGTAGARSRRWQEGPGSRLGAPSSLA